jgi:hypothetical protein
MANDEMEETQEELEELEETEEELEDIDVDEIDELELESEEEVEVPEIEEEEEGGEGDEALDELEEEELELLEDEVSETLLIDEAEELRAIRREELTMNVDAHAVRPDEFVCQSCFLVKRTSQLANRRKMICRDCAS